MIEPLVDTASEPEISQPNDVEIVLDGITFKDGKLWQSRYPSLIQYDRIPGVQVEPALLIRTKEPLEVRILFDLAEGQGISFVKEEGNRVKCRSLDRPLDQEVPGLVKALWESETSCTLVWNQAAANAHAQGRVQEMTVLRLYCQGGYQPANAWEEAVTAVEGGLYLAILYNPREGDRSPQVDLAPRPFLDPCGEALQPEVHIFDIDAHGRPVCNLFRPLFDRVPSLDQDVEIEVAFRARDGESVEMDLTLDVPDLKLRWKNLGGEAEVIPFPAQSDRPWQLQSARLLGDDGKTCRIHWHQQTCRSNDHPGESEATPCDRTIGRVYSFLLKVDTTGEGVVRDLIHRYNLDKPGRSIDRFVARMAVDPTVIEPPTCTPEGVCIPSGGGKGGGGNSTFR